MSKIDLDDLSPSVRREIAFRKMYPSIYRWGTHDSSDAGSIKILRRGADDWLAMVKGYDGDGGPIICFGSGSSMLEALASAEGGVASGRWRVDKPYEAKK